MMAMGGSAMDEETNTENGISSGEEVDGGCESEWEVVPDDEERERGEWRRGE